MQDDPEIKISEIFYSLQGETSFVGLPTVFVRLTGCPLRCNYCDTAYAFSGGKRSTVKSILNTVQSYSPRYVTVTGGEPLAQPACLVLLQRLCDLGYTVSLETSGAINIEGVDQRVTTIMDLKTPSSRESERNLYANLNYLKPTDQVKFVIADKSDFDWAKEIIEEYRIVDRAHVLFSPSHGVLENEILADWIVEGNLPVRFQVQLHKYIWDEDRGR